MGTSALHVLQAQTPEEALAALAEGMKRRVGSSEQAKMKHIARCNECLVGLTKSWVEKQKGLETTSRTLLQIHLLGESVDSSSCHIHLCAKETARTDMNHSSSRPTGRVFGFADIGGKRSQVPDP